MKLTQDLLEEMQVFVATEKQLLKRRVRTKNLSLSLSFNTYVSTWKIRIQLSLFYLCSGGNILLSYLLDSIPHSADALCFCGKNKLPKSENCTDSGSTSFGFRLVFWYHGYLKNIIRNYTCTWDILYSRAHTIQILWSASMNHYFHF